MQTAAALQKREKQKNPESAGSVVQKKGVAEPEEHVAKTGVPLFLQRVSSSASPPPFQRESDEEENGQDTPVFQKITVGASNDRYEKEADQFADAVMSMTDAATGEKESPVETKTLFGQASPLIYRMPEQMADKDQMQVQAKPASGQTPETSPGLGKQNDALRQSGGQALQIATRTFFESRLGHDFSDVRVHTGEAAASAACSVRAMAYTCGRNIVFGRGKYAPHTSEGRRLLAHELVHVVQRAEGHSPQVDPTSANIAPAHHPLERGAEAAAVAIFQDRLVPADALVPAGRGAVAQIFRNGDPTLVASPPPHGVAADLLEALILPDRSGFTDPLLDIAYRAYRDRGGIAEPAVWAVRVKTGAPRERLEQLLGPDYAAGHRGGMPGPAIIDVSTIQMPPGYSPQDLARDLELLRDRPDLLLAHLNRMTESPIDGNEINIGHYNILKGNVAELLSLPRRLEALEEVRRHHPDAELYSGVTARFYQLDGTLTGPVAFSDDIIASARFEGLVLHRLFEVKSGSQGGAQATEQVHRWIEGHATWGMVINLPGIDIDFHYSDTTRLVRNLTTAPREILSPEGTEHLGMGSADQVVAPVERRSIGRTPEQIAYLTRLVVEEVAQIQQAVRMADQAGSNAIRPALMGSPSQLTSGAEVRRIEREYGGLALVEGRLYRVSTVGNAVSVNLLPVSAIAVPMVRPQKGSMGGSTMALALQPGVRGEAGPGHTPALPTRSVGGQEERGSIKVPGTVPPWLAQHPNIINYSGRQIILEGRTLVPTPTTTLQPGDYVIVGCSKVGWVLNPRTLRPIARAFQGGEWYRLEPGGWWVMEIDAAGRVRQPGSPHYVISRGMPHAAYGKPHPVAVEQPMGGAGQSGGKRLAAGGLGIIMIANEILGPIGNTRQLQRHNIEMRQARLRFWIQFGANPIWEIRTQNTGEVMPFTSRPSTSVFGQPTYHYVSDIDADAFRRNLSASIGTYQDLILWLEMAKSLGVVRVEPPMPRIPTATDRSRSRHYLAIVDGPSGGRARSYDITATIQRIEQRTLEQTEAEMRADVGSLSAQVRGNIFRLRSGSGTPLYRSAHGQRILSAQHLLGPNPWVRPAGRRVGGGAWSWFRRGHYSARIMVIPANADAQRSALVSAYQINEKIDDVLNEVRNGGRPILSRQPMSGRLESFVAGPASGDPRFGETRYYRHQQRPNLWTVAIGQLNRFWVDEDQLEPVGIARVDEYLRQTDEGF